MVEAGVEVTVAGAVGPGRQSRHVVGGAESKLGAALADRAEGADIDTAHAAGGGFDPLVLGHGRRERAVAGGVHAGVGALAGAVAGVGVARAEAGLRAAEAGATDADAVAAQGEGGGGEV